MSLMNSGAVTAFDSWSKNSFIVVDINNSQRFDKGASPRFDKGASPLVKNINIIF